MKRITAELIENTPIARNIYKAVFACDTSGIACAGQFVNVQINGLYLRRPISVCDYSENSLTLVYKVVGKGTEILSRAKRGDKFDILTGLGNGYDLQNAGNTPLLIGGGVGVPPLYNLAKQLIKQGKKVYVALGFNTKEEMFFVEEFKKLGCVVSVATADGSAGKNGFVIDALPEEYSYFYACGPTPMLKAVYAKTQTDGEFSFEERMGCGFGACMGCSCKTLFGSKRVCKDGPVFKKGEILW